MTLKLCKHSITTSQHIRSGKELERKNKINENSSDGTGRLKTLCDGTYAQDYRSKCRTLHFWLLPVTGQSTWMALTLQSSNYLDTHELSINRSELYSTRKPPARQKTLLHSIDVCIPKFVNCVSDISSCSLTIPAVLEFGIAMTSQTQLSASLCWGSVRVARLDCEVAGFRVRPPYKIDNIGVSSTHLLSILPCQTEFLYISLFLTCEPCRHPNWLLLPRIKASRATTWEVCAVELGHATLLASFNLDLEIIYNAFVLV